MGKKKIVYIYWRGPEMVSPRVQASREWLDENNYVCRDPDCKECRRLR